MREFSWMRPLFGGVSMVAMMGGVAGIVTPAVAQAETHRFQYEHVLGTTLEIVATSPNAGTALIAANAARAEIARLDLILSTWREDSEIARLNRSGVANVSGDLLCVLEACEKWRIETDNAFDARIGSLVSLWRASAEQNAAPQAAQLAANADDIRASGIRLDTDKKTIALSPSIQLSVDGLAKGYIIDAALDAARKAAPALSGLMINIGGDLRCWGVSPQGDCWRIGVSDPSHLEDNAAPSLVLALNDLAVATSGKGLRDLIIEGAAHSHILSPQSGAPVTRIVSATVVARRAMDADALATAFSVLGPAESLSLARGIRDVEALIVTSDGAAHVSDGWGKLVADSAAPNLLQRTAGFIGDLLISPAEAATAGNAWPSDFALKIE